MLRVTMATVNKRRLTPPSGSNETFSSAHTVNLKKVVGWKNTPAVTKEENIMRENYL